MAGAGRADDVVMYGSEAGDLSALALNVAGPTVRRPTGRKNSDRNNNQPDLKYMPAGELALIKGNQTTQVRGSFLE
jgi:hypothetical protein